MMKVKVKSVKTKKWDKRKTKKWDKTKNETNTKNETKQKQTNETKQKQANFCVSPFLVSILLFCQYSAQGTVCSGKFTFCFFFSMEWSNVILSGTSEFQNQNEEGPSKNCCDWVFNILGCFDMSRFVKGFGRGRGGDAENLTENHPKQYFVDSQRDMTALNDFHFGCPALNSQLWTGKLEFK